MDPRVREVGQSTAVIHVEMGEDDVPYVCGVVAEALHLPDSGLVLRQDRLRHRDPVGAERARRVANVVQPDPRFDQDQPVGCRLDQ